jgi:hypothetical protein
VLRPGHTYPVPDPCKVTWVPGVDPSRAAQRGERCPRQPPAAAILVCDSAFCEAHRHAVPATLCSGTIKVPRVASRQAPVYRKSQGLSNASSARKHIGRISVAHF